MVASFSVVLPTKERHGRIEKLSEALESFEKQEKPPQYEIMLVDENPGTGVDELVESSKIRDRIEYLPLPGAGVVAATNEAVKRARGDFIFFAGDDMTADSRMLAEHAIAQKNQENTAVLGWTKWHPSVRKTPLSDFARSIGPQLDPKYLPADKSNLPFYFFMTANLSIKKQALLDAGLFDEGFKYPAYEDCELGYRLTKNGARIVFNERALAYHNHDITLKQLCDRQRKIGHGMVLFAKKHPQEKTIAAKVGECKKHPFGERTAKMLEGVTRKLEGGSLVPLLRFNYMLLYNTYLALGVREEFSGVEYKPPEGAY